MKQLRGWIPNVGRSSFEWHVLISLSHRGPCVQSPPDDSDGLDGLPDDFVALLGGMGSKSVGSRSSVDTPPNKNNVRVKVLYTYLN